MEPTINPLLDAREATAFLGIKRETLYAYVSRGLVRSVPAEEGRGRLYFRSDLEQLKARHDARAGHGAVAGSALRWGEPVLDSAITRIDAELGPVYRAAPAIELAERGVPFEAVASLLWGGPLEAARFEADGLGIPARVAAELAKDPSPLALLAIVVPLLAARDAERFGAPDAAELPRARVLIARMAASLALSTDRANVARAAGASRIAATLAIALGTRSAEAARAIDVALVLSADHELNPSTFAARVVASSGADLYACVAAAIAALSGPRHGGTCDRIEALVEEAGDPARAARIVRERTRRGEAIPGFGHRLYPERDPRTPPLLDVAHAIAPRAPAVRTLLALVRAMQDTGREAPTLDVGLVAVASALGLPRGAAVALFAIGRTAGWIAHALEQRSADFLLRPRARYVGP